MTVGSILLTQVGEASSWVPVLECIVNDGVLAIATDVVGQIVEYEVAELPLARDHVSGLAVIDGRLVVSLSPSSAATKGGRRWTKGVILHLGAEHVGITFALEVREVRSLVDVTVSRSSAKSSAPWFSPAVTRDGREVYWLDARELVRRLTGVSTLGAGT